MTLQRFKLIFAAVLTAGTLGFSQVQEMNLDVSEPAAMLEPEHKNALKDNKTKITIRANVNDAEVFLNGQYEGNTTLVINSLPEGRYHLRVEKKGYEPKRYSINVRAGQEQSFYIELQKYEGYVTFKAQPQDCTIYVDDSRISGTTVLLSEGEHTVTAKKFGFESQSATIFVFRNTYQQVSFELLEAAFKLSDFSSNKSVFNPALPGSMGKIKFSFSVTNKGTGTLSVLDENGNQIFSTTLPEFSTWQQSVLWDGTVSGGEKLPDGKYTAFITCEGQTLSVSFSADSSISIPAASLTQSGSGIGVLPMAFRYPKNTIALAADAGAIFATNGRNFYASPLSLGFAWQPLDFMEVSGRGGVLLGRSEGTSHFFTGTFKFAWKHQFKNISGAFDYGILARIGELSKSPYEPYGQDNGGGLGGGIVLGLDFSKFFTGFSSEFTYSTSTYDGTKKDSVLRNGLAFQLKEGNVAASISGAVNTSFGCTGLENDNRTSSSTEIFRCLEAGFDFQFQPALSQFFVNVRGQAVHFKNKNYFKAEAGFTVLL